MATPCRSAIERIDEKRTVLLAYRTADGRLPGEVPEYTEYLQKVLAESKYTTGANPVVKDQCCAAFAAASTLTCIRTPCVGLESTWQTSIATVLSQTLCPEDAWRKDSCAVPWLRADLLLCLLVPYGG